MQKLLTLSIVLATVIIPIWAALEKNPRKAFKKAIFWFVCFNAFYVFALRFIFPRLY
jgi:hypothetical protein